ncbi:hypothetical protein [Pedobacter nototheniae]|uniref:hypothetical protein n=1 Tax=Pedobacter nototheniae TaxID=2488994 RepID=UPI002930D9EF|nr:hypothetical protein [Pedobacter nototheniae]
MKYKHLFLMLSLFVIACNNQPNPPLSTENTKTKAKNKDEQDSLRAVKKLTHQINLNVNAFHKTMDSLKLGKGMFPIENYIYDSIPGDDYNYALFYLKFMAAARSKDEAKITAMVHFPFQTTKEKLKYDRESRTYKVIGAENWNGGLLSKKQFNVAYHKIFTNEILENIPETRQKDVMGSFPGNVKINDDYYGQLRAFTDAGSNMYAVSIELPVKKRKYTNVRFIFGRVNGEYKVLSYFLE